MSVNSGDKVYLLYFGKDGDSGCLVKICSSHQSAQDIIKDKWGYMKLADDDRNVEIPTIWAGVDRHLDRTRWARIDEWVIDN